MEGLPSVQFSGLATGIDTARLIDALVQTERLPILRIQNRQASLNSISSSFTTLLNRLNELESKAKDLKDQTGINATQTSTSSEDFLSVSSDGNASAGVYNVVVKQLAQREKEASQGFADVDTESAGTGTLSITVGGVQTDVPITNGTLGGIKDAIKASGAEVDVTILNDGSASPFRLLVTAREAGDANTITLDESGLSGGTKTLSFGELQAAQSSIVEVDTIEITRESNLLTDVIEGVTLNLTSADETQTTEITIEVDVEGIKENVQGFIDKYNSVMSFINDQTRFNNETGAAGRLLGDYTVNNVQRRLRSLVTGAISGATGDFGSLSQIGIRTGVNGQLSIDSEEFQDAVEQDLQGVLSLFQEGEGNISGSLEDYLKEATRSGDGILASRQSSIKNQVKDLQTRVDYHERRVERFQQAQTRRFAALERTISGLQSQQAFLQARF